MNVKQHVDHWRNGAAEEWDMAEIALERGRYRHALFFQHLTIEKFLKALVCLNRKASPPRIHNLLRLSTLAELDSGEERLKLFLELNDYCMEGRYPGELAPLPTRQEAMGMKQRVQKARQWLLNLL